MGLIILSNCLFCTCDQTPCPGAEGDPPRVPETAGSGQQGPSAWQPAGAVSVPDSSGAVGLHYFHVYAQVASLMGHFVAEMMLYPLETVLHRLHLQVTTSTVFWLCLDCWRERQHVDSDYFREHGALLTIWTPEGKWCLS